MVGRRRQFVALTCVVVLVLFAAGAAYTTSGGSSLSPSDQALLQDASARATYVYNHSKGTNRADAQAIGTDLATVLTPAVTTTTTGGASSTSTTAPTTTSGSRSTTTSSSTTAPATTTSAPAAGCTSTIGPGQSISSAATAGTLCLRAGVYSQLVTLSHAGVTVQSAPGELAVIDGAGAALSSTGSVVNVTAANVTFSGIEVRNSSGRGLTATGTGDRVIGSTFDQIQFNGILAAGTNQTVDRNTVFNTVLSNVNDARGNAGWAEAINSWRATNVTVTNNVVHDSWGEGIDFIDTSGAVASGNTVTDCFSVLIYTDGSSNVQISGNRLSTTNANFNRSSGAPFGVLIASEGGGAIHDIAVTTNVLSHTSGISMWNVTPTNLTIANNTIS